EEATQAVGAAVVFTVVGTWIGLMLGWRSGLPWVVLGPMIGLTIGAAIGCCAGWWHYQHYQPKGTRVEEGDLPTATGHPTPSTTPPTQPALPSTAVTQRPAVSFVPPANMLRVGKLARHYWAVEGVAIAPDVRTAVTSGGEGTIVCHDLASGLGVWN